MKDNRPTKQNIISTAFKTILKKIGWYSMFFQSEDKYDTELAFQKMWSEEFRVNKHIVREYWEKYRYLNEILSTVGFTDSTKVLDVGCGISTVLHYIPGQKHGIDPLADKYQKLYAYPEDVQIQKAWGEDEVFTNEYFDVIFCTNALDHVTDPRKTIDNIQRMLKNDGFFILTLELFTEVIERDAAHPHCLTKSRVMQLLGDRFKAVLEKESPWIGLRRYVIGERSHKHNELILILQKNKPSGT